MKRKAQSKLPKHFKAAWIKALTSGEFKQGQLALHNKTTDSYCCLGVACRIVHPRMDFGNKGTINHDSFGDKLKRIKVPDILKHITDENPIADKLIRMNDTGKTFEQIARYIKRYL